VRTKRVNRYYCDCCKKSGCSKGHMATHEAHCTANPGRTCRLCEEVFNPSPAELAAIVTTTKAALAAIPQHTNEWGHIEMSIDAVRKVVADVKDATETCPACTLAVLRQAGADMGLVGATGWSFKDELASWWADADEGQRTC